MKMEMCNRYVFPESRLAGFLSLWETEENMFEINILNVPQKLNSWNLNLLFLRIFVVTINFCEILENDNGKW